MLKLYFGNASSIISTVLIIAFGLFFGLVNARRGTVAHWGTMVLLMFFLGLFMSMMSGFKDGMATPASVIPMKHWTMTVLCILGGLAFLAGIVSIFIRKQNFWQVSFYIISFVIIAKVILTEAIRVVHYFKQLS